MPPFPGESQERVDPASYEFVNTQLFDSIELPPDLPIPSSEQVNNTGPKYSKEKAQYLRSIGLSLPEEWFAGEGDALTTRPDHVSCVNVACIVMSWLPSWVRLADEHRTRVWTDDEFREEVYFENSRLASRIDREGWRKRYEGKPYLTREGRERAAGRPTNTTSLVSPAEIQTIVDAVATRFQRR